MAVRVPCFRLNGDCRTGTRTLDYILWEVYTDNLRHLPSRLRTTLTKTPRQRLHLASVVVTNEDMMKATGMTVGRKLALGFGVTVMLLMAVAALGLYSLQQVQGRLEEIVKVNNQQARQAVAMRIAINQVASATRNIVLLEDAQDIAAEVKQIQVSRERYNQAEAKLAQLFEQHSSTTAPERELFERIKQQRDIVRPLNNKVVELGERNQTEAATKVLMQEVRPPQALWLKSLGELADMEEKLSEEAAEAAEAAYASARQWMVALVLLAVALAVGTAVFFTRGLLRQLGGEPAYATEVANRIAAGDLTSQVNLRQGDRSSLLFAISQMQTGLVQVVASIRSGADSIATGSTQIATGNADLSQRTEEQASNLQQTAASMEQLTSTVQANAQAASQASQLAREASQSAQAGNESVSRVMATMGDINAASQRIGDIIGTIDGIAFQTNILALNAAVEAARAGEQGRGFAVVAGEVRALAQRSSQAAKEVKGLITASAEKVQLGSEQVTEAGQTMERILQSVKRVENLMSDINSATEEQSQGIGQVGAAVQQLDQVTQQNAALVEESAAAAESLRAQADRLVQSVAAFKTSEHVA